MNAKEQRWAKEEIIAKVSAASGVQISKLRRIGPRIATKETLIPQKRTFQLKASDKTTESIGEKGPSKSSQIKKFAKKGKTFAIEGILTGES